jgi:phage-related baseplate assembly protein
LTLLAPSVDYTSVDFDSLRARLVALVESVFPEWTDHDVAGFGNILVEMFAFVGDVLGYYLDNQAREAFLTTALRRENVIALARRLGYRMSGATAATAELELRLAAVPRARTVLAAGSLVRTREAQNPVRFQLLQDLMFEPGMNPPVVRGVVEHSAAQRQVFDARSLRGTDLVLDRTPFLDRSARVAASNGDYTEADSLLSSGPNDRHFVVLVDQNDRATLRFGDGRLGATPTGSIEVRYKTGGGAAGNVDAGQITVFDGVPKDVEGQPVSLVLTNPERASGGTERESIGSAKLLAPLSVRATTRSVAREDFEIHALELPGVARALMVTSNEDAAVQENSGVLYVIPKGGGLPTPALKNQVKRQVTEVYPCTLTFQVDVRDPVYKRVDIRARLFVRAGERPEVVRDRVRARLQEFFRLSMPDGTPNELVDFGYYLRDDDGNVTGELPYSDVYNVVRDTAGVRKIGDHSGDLLLNGLPADVKLRAFEFPILGSVEVTDGATGRLL